MFHKFVKLSVYALNGEVLFEEGHLDWNGPIPQSVDSFLESPDAKRFDRIVIQLEHD